METEKRSFDSEIRAVDKGGGVTWLDGTAAVFAPARSQDLGGFFEEIDPHAFDGSLTSDVRALVDHNPSLILGRTTSKTLRLSVDERGLNYSVKLPATGYARDLVESVSRGDISGSSFAFRATDDSWAKRDGMDVRTIRKAALVDVSVCTFPAYPQTDASVARRSYEIHTGTGRYADPMARAKAKIEMWERELAEDYRRLDEERWR